MPTSSRGIQNQGGFIYSHPLFASFDMPLEVSRLMFTLPKDIVLV